MTNSPEFFNATKVVINLLSSPSDDELSDLYGLYKQAIVGINMTEKPSFINYKAYRKWLSWTSFNVLSTRPAVMR